jgi:hypothetical protein
VNRSILLGFAGLSIIGAAALAQTPNRLALVCAFYAGEAAAASAHERMKTSESFFGQGVQSFAVLTKDINGNTRVIGRKSGAPLPTRIVQAAASLTGAPQGAAYTSDSVSQRDFLSSAQVGLPEAGVNRLKGALGPGQSAIIAVVDDRWATETRQRMAEAGLIDTVSFNVAPAAAY